MNQKYIIVHKDDISLVWSNQEGWINDIPEGTGNPTLFHPEEVSLLNLPIDGEWLEI